MRLHLFYARQYSRLISTTSREIFFGGKQRIEARTAGLEKRMLPLRHAAPKGTEIVCEDNPTNSFLLQNDDPAFHSGY